MATETLEVDGRRFETLVELLRPGLRAVVVGLNPSVVSVEAGHYFQGRLGKRMWQRLQQAGILADLTPGFEDDEAFRHGIGFADVVRAPSPRADHLTVPVLRRAGPELRERLLAAGVQPPTKLVFVYSRAFEAVGPLFRENGFTVLRMPGPYASAGRVAAELTALAREVGGPEGR